MNLQQEITHSYTDFVAHAVLSMQPLGALITTPSRLSLSRQKLPLPALQHTSEKSAGPLKP